MKNILLIAFLMGSFFAQSQTRQYKYSYSFSITGNNTASDNKNNIDFLRNHFNTKKCTYDTSNSTYTLFLNHLINPIILKKKLIAIGIHVNNEIQLKHLDTTANQSQSNQN